MVVSPIVTGFGGYIFGGEVWQGVAAEGTARHQSSPVPVVVGAGGVLRCPVVLPALHPAICTNMKKEGRRN